MKIVVIHGHSHKGMTYTMTKEVLERFASGTDEVREFFLPKDGPDFCIGCNNCFMKGETYCPCADKVQPIALGMEWADVILLDSPNYALEMSGSMKNLLDHLAYRWVTHRPHGTMFTKVAVTLCSSAGAPAGHTAKSMAKALKWMGVPKVYCFPFTSFAMGTDDLKPKKREELIRKADRVAHKLQRRMAHTGTSLRGRLFFRIFRKMQSEPDAAWNPIDRDWWVDQGWTKDVRPWKKQQG